MPCVTTTDGTQYFFGSTPASTWTVPVFGNHTGEPCHGTAFIDSDCVQAWRWMLDKVIDRNGNTMTFEYDNAGLSAVVDTLGHRILIEHNSNGLISSVTAWKLVVPTWAPNFADFSSATDFALAIFDDFSVMTVWRTR